MFDVEPWEDPRTLAGEPLGGGRAEAAQVDSVHSNTSFWQREGRLDHPVFLPDSSFSVFCFEDLEFTSPSCFDSFLCQSPVGVGSYLSCAVLRRGCAALVSGPSAPWDLESLPLMALALLSLTATHHHPVAPRRLSIPLFKHLPCHRPLTWQQIIFPLSSLRNQRLWIVSYACPHSPLFRASWILRFLTSLHNQMGTELVACLTASPCD